MSKILTIGIPTFNRAPFLDICLDSLFSQIKPIEQYITVFVADNASTDKTSEIILKYIKLGFSINYYKQDKNLGMDGNFISLYEKCDTRFFWLLSDDDFVLPSSLQQIVELLNAEDPGLVHLGSFWYKDIVDYNKISKIQFKVVKYTQSIEFFQKVNYWFTFISGNIVNKSIIAAKIDPYIFKNTYLSQLAWIVPTVFELKPNFVIEKPVIACRSNNSGGYKLATVFAKNYHRILKELIKKGCPQYILPMTLNNLFEKFFPLFIHTMVSGDKKYARENHFWQIFKIGWLYKRYWKFVFPVYIRAYCRKLLTIK